MPNQDPSQAIAEIVSGRNDVVPSIGGLAVSAGLRQEVYFFNRDGQLVIPDCRRPYDTRAVDDILVLNFN